MIKAFCGFVAKCVQNYMMAMPNVSILFTAALRFKLK